METSNKYTDFPAVRNKCEDIIDSYIRKEFENRPYDPKEAQKLSNDASEEIIRQVQEKLGEEIELKFTATVILL